MENATAARLEGQLGVLVPTRPAPWDDVYLPRRLRWTRTFGALTRAPRTFFEVAALDRSGGAAWLLCLGLAALCVPIGALAFGFVLAARSSLPVGLVFAELMGAAVLLGVGFAVAYAALVRAIALRADGVKHLPRASWLRLFAFSSAPLVFGVLPILGTAIGILYAVRALGAGLVVHLGVSEQRARAMTVGPLFALGVAAGLLLLGLVIAL